MLIKVIMILIILFIVLLWIILIGVNKLKFKEEKNIEDKMQMEYLKKWRKK